ncbi:MAG: ribosome silencing factor [Candidatus Omnitrophica bacterium]|jgi:ribosome-associated protein|nr:ribosome silencing factor [Candidatus Omnitrophota bacterium]MDD5081052.1 ribosome silencing factor [Candidatus Omnitrophota bacterium]MDD5441407.1 ribosome silencing factor [Candidatus Omnitrophota bacterium]
MTKKTLKNNDEIKNKALGLMELTLDKKAIDPVAIHVTESCNFCHYFIVCSAESPAQVRAIYEYVADKSKKLKLQVSNKQIDKLNTWGIVDFFDIILHVFDEQSRTFYGLENLWEDDDASNVITV